MKIASIEVWNFCPHFRDGPYVMSHVTQYAAYGRILRVTANNGVSGWGEVVFAPLMTPEDRQHRVNCEQDYLPELIGQDTDALASLAEKMRHRGKFWCGVAFGLDTAFLDLTGRHRKQPISHLIGGAAADAVEGYYSLSERTTDRIKERITGADRKNKVIQLKIGIDSIADDTAHVKAALDVMSENQILLADANGGWSVDEALQIIGRFDDPRIVWEEPCRTYDDNAQVARESNVNIMVDQCVGDFATAVRAAKERIAASICIKPAFLGGLIAAHQVRDICIEAGTKMRIDGPWWGDIATASILHLAIGAPPKLIVAGADLRGPLVIEPDLGGVAYVNDTCIAPPPGAGLGIEIDNEAIGLPEAVYCN